MEPQVVGWLALAAMLILLFLRVPVAFTLALVGFFGYVVLSGLDAGMMIAGTIPYRRTAQYALTVIPLFIIMGSFMERAGMVADVYDTAKKWVGGSPGGLVQATTIFGAIFGGPCGSGIAGVATVGRLCIPEMLKNGVQRALAFGTVAAVGPLSAMIPPSNIMVVFGIITDTSIGKLLVAGFIPGFVAAAVFLIMVYVRVKVNPSLAPPITQHVTWRERFLSLKSIWGITFVMVVVMGGIYTGIFTPTEAGGVGAFATFAMALAMNRLSWSSLKNILFDTARTTGALFLLLAAASIFGYLLAITRIPNQVSEAIIGLQVNRWVVFAAVAGLYLVMGCFLDSVTQMILTMPIIFPAMIALHFDPIWFGIIFVHLCELGMITPPFALSIFVLQGLFPEVSTGEIIRGVMPYIFAEMVILALYVAIPGLALWLPSMMT